VLESYTSRLKKKLENFLPQSDAKNAKQEWKKGRIKRNKREGSRAFVCCSLYAFIRFRSLELFSRIVELCFMATRPRERGWRDERIERKTRRCLTKLRGIKFAFYCARFLNASSRRERGKLPSAIATIVRSDNSPISFRDMDTMSPFDPLVGSHGESTSGIKIHTCLIRLIADYDSDYQNSKI